MSEEKKSFWETLPGILTGTAAVLTALAGLLTVIYTRGQKAPESKEKEEVHAPVKKNERDRSVTAALMEKPVRQRVSIAGLWRDAYLGNQVKITQEGNRVTSVTIDLLSRQMVARGQGLLKGRAIEGSNEWMNGEVYSLSMNVSENGKEITGIARSTTTGQSSPIRLVR